MSVDTAAPVISSVTPPDNGSYGATQNLDFTVNTSENIVVDVAGGAPTIALTVGSTSRAAEYLSGTGTSAIKFRYIVQDGETDSDGIASAALAVLNGGTLRDAAGNDLTLTFTAPVTTSVLVDTTAPTLSSVSPPSNGGYKEGQNLEFTANYNETVTVNTTGGTPSIGITIGTSSKSAAYVSGTGTAALVFRYTVANSDADNDGIAASSPIELNGGTILDAAQNNAALSFTVPDTSSVLVDAGAPTLSSITGPTDGSFGTGQNLDFNVTYSEAITVDTSGGTPSISLTIGSTTRTASYVTGNGTSVLVFRYTIVSGDSDTDGIEPASSIVLNSGTFIDAGGNDAPLSFTAPTLTSVLVDTTAPSMNSIARQSPTSTTIDASSVTFRVTFSESVNGVGLADFEITKTDTASGAVSAVSASSGTTIDVTVDNVTATGTIRLDLKSSGTGITDAASNAVSGGFTSGETYSVVPDATAPTVSSIRRKTPLAFTTDAVSVVWEVTFSESVSGVDIADFEITQTDTAVGTIASVSTSSGTTIDVTANSVAGNGTLRLDLKSSGTDIVDGASLGIASGFTSGEAYTIDTTVALPIVQNYDGKSSSDVTADGWLLSGDATVTSDFLQMTPRSRSKFGTAIYNKSFNSGFDINIQFDYQMLSSSQPTGGRMGVSVFLLDGSVATPVPGARTTSLGYLYGRASDNASAAGLTKAYIGVLIDRRGSSVSTSDFQDGIASSRQENTISLRGPGTQTSSTRSTDPFEYRYVTDSAVNFSEMSGTTARKVNLTLKANGTATMSISTDGGSTFTTIYDNIDFANSSAFSGYTRPDTFKIGFAASTGNGDNPNEHRIDNLTISLPVDLVTAFTESPSGTPLPGDSVTYKVTVTNNGPNPDSAAEFSYNVPSDITGVNWSYSISGGGATGNGTGNAIGATLNLAVDAVATFTITGTLGSDSKGQTLSHSATVTESGNLGESDSSNNTATISTTVGGDVTAPTISSVTGPSNATYVAGQDLDFTVNFSESVDVNLTSGSPTLSLTVGSASATAAYLSGSGSTVLKFRYTVQSGDSDADGIGVSSPLVLNNAVIQDSAANALTGLTFTVPDTSGVLIDTTAPSISNVSQPGDATYVSGQNLDFTVTYNEAAVVDTGSGTPTIALTVGSIPRTAVYQSGSGTTALLFRYATQTEDSDADGINVDSKISLNGGTIKDAAGNTAGTSFSALTTTGVRVDTSVPSLTTVSMPVNATYRAGQTLDFTVNYSEPVTVVTTGGIPTLGLTIGSSSVNAALQSGTGSASLLFRYTVQAGETDSDGIAVASPLVLNGGTIKDAAGNDAGLTFTAPTTTGVLVDTTAPSISSVTGPSSGSYGAGIAFDFTVNVSENVTVDISGGTPSVALTIGSTSRSAKYVSGGGSDALLFRYTTVAGENDSDGIALTSPVVLNSGMIRDGAGNDSSLTFTSPDTTGVLVDTTAPSITNVAGPSDGTYVASQNLDFTVTVSEAVTVTTTDGTPSIEVVVGTALRTAGYVSGSNGTQLVFRYTTQLGDSDIDGIDSGSAIELNGGTIKDTAGNDSGLSFIAPTTTGVLVDTSAPNIASLQAPVDGRYRTGDVLAFTANFNEKVTVAGGTPSLTVTIGSTAQNATYVSGSDTSALVFQYTVQASENDSDGISLVSPISLNSATIKDASGNEASLTFNVPGTTGVLVDNTAPTISNVTPPSDGTYRATQDLDFAVTYDESVNVIGTPRLSLTIGTATRTAYYVSGDGTTQLVFRHVVQTGATDSDGIAATSPISLNGGTIKDLAGNDAGLTFTSPNTSSVLIDTTAPTLASVSGPSSGNYRAGQVLEFTATFSETVTATGTPRIALTIGSAIRHADLASGSGSTALVFQYTIAAGDNDRDGIVVASPIDLNSGSIADAGGNGAQLTFNAPDSSGVLVDTQTPSISSVTPPSDGTYREGQKLIFSVNYDESVTVSGGTPSLTLTIGSETRNGTMASSNNGLLVFEYTVQVGETDADGIALATTLVLNGATIKDAAGNDGGLTFSAVDLSGVKIDTTAPTITAVAAPADGTYILGQALEFRVAVSEGVTVNTVEGIPALNLSIGSHSRAAVYISTESDGKLLFQHVLQGDDLDNDGIAVLSPLALNSGTIRDTAGNDLELVFTEPTATGVLVDAIVPAFSSMTVPSDGSYRAGQDLSFTVTFDEAVRVVTTSGTPYIPLNLGPALGRAEYKTGNDTTQLTFEYTVQPGDTDTDGITIGTAIKANGGTLKDAAGNVAERALTLPSSSEILVDTTPPAVVSIERLEPAFAVTRKSTLIYRVNFSERVNGVHFDDFELAATVDGNIASVSASSGTSVDVTVNSVAGTGLLRLDLKASGTGITDVAGNAIEVGFTGGQTYEMDPSPQFSQDGFGFNGLLTVQPLSTDVSLAGHAAWPDGFNKEANAFVGAVFDGQGIWMIPYAADRVVRVDRTSGAMTGFSAWPDGFSKSGAAFAGGVYDGQNVWLIPANADRVVRIDSTGTMSGFSAWPDGFTKGDLAFSGGISDGQNIWLAPHGADRVIQVDKTTGAMTGFMDWPAGFTKTTSAFSSAVFDGEYLWLIPLDADRVVRVNPADGTMTGFNSWPDGFTKGFQSFAGAVSDASFIWLIPKNADRVVRLNKSSGEMAGFSNWPNGFSKSNNAFAGGAFDGQSVWLVPADADRVVRLDRNSGTMTGYNAWPDGFAKGSGAFLGGVFDGDENIWMVPHNADRVVRVTGPDLVAPALLTLAPPVEGVYGEGQNLEFSATFDERVRLTELSDTAPEFEIKVGSEVRSAQFVSGDDSDTLRFAYTVQPGDSDADGIEVTGASIVLNDWLIQDRSENDAGVTFTAPDGSSIIVDTTGPTATGIDRWSPASTHAKAGTVVFRASFSENVSGADFRDFELVTTGNVTGFIDTVFASGEGTVDVTVINVKGSGTIGAKLLESGTGISDLAGNGIVGGFAAGQTYTVDTEEPVISEIANQTTLEDTPTGAIVFTVSDTVSDAGSLSLAVESSNFLLLPRVNIELAGADGNRTLNATPNPDGFGTSTVTVSVSDQAGNMATTTFDLTVTSVNDPPLIEVDQPLDVDEETLLEISVFASDPDLPPENLAIVFQGDVPTGVALDSSDGTLSWTPTEDQGGQDYSFTTIVSDSGSPSQSDTNTFTVTVVDINKAPVLTSINDISVLEGASVNFTASATDSDIPVDTLTFSLDAGAPSGANIDSATGQFSWSTSESDGPGSFPVTVRVTDSGTPSLNTAQRFTIAVTELNTEPTLATVVDQFINEGETLNVVLGATDSDLPANALRFGLVNGPTGMTVDPTTGLVSWSTGEGEGPGTYAVAVNVSDNGAPALSTVRNFQVHVAESNNAPVLASIADQTVTELETLTLQFSASDTDLPANRLIYALGTAPEGAVLNEANGQFTWAPTEAQGPGSYTINVGVRDDAIFPLSATQSFQVVVEESNQAPFLPSFGGILAEEGQENVIPLVAFDSDEPAQTITWTLSADAPEGVTLDSSIPALRWTPTEAQGPGIYSFGIEAADSGELSQKVTATVTVAVTESNQEPVIGAVAPLTVSEGEIAIVNVSATDADLPAQQLSYSLADGMPPGAGINSSNGQFAWTPGETEGPGSFTITALASDNGTPPATGSVTFRIDVTEGNLAPVLAQVAPQVVHEGETLSVVLAANDADTPSQTLRFALGANAPAGVNVDGTTGLLTWVPTEVQGPGSFVVPIEVTDDGFPPLKGAGSVTVQVGEVNQPPALSPIEGQVVLEGQGFNLTLLATDPDVPANSFSFGLASGPDGMTVDATTGLVSWTPEKTLAGTSHTVAVTVNDNGTPSLQGERTFNVSIVGVNDAPVIGGPAEVQLTEDTVGTITGVSVSDLDAGEATIEVSLSVVSGQLSVDPVDGVTISGENSNQINLSGSITGLNQALTSLSYQGKENLFGDDVLSMGVNDLGNTGEGGPLNAQFNVALLIAPVNDAPTIGVVSNQTTQDGQLLGPIAFTVDDIDNAPEALVVRGSSSNDGLVASEGITTDGIGTSRTVSVQPILGQIGTSTITLEVTDSAGASGSVSFELVVTPLPPVIVSEMENPAVLAGGSITLAPIVQGTPPLSFQWFLNGEPVSGATQATLELTDAQVDQSGLYTLEVTNSEGSIVVEVANVSVNAELGITAEPTDLSIIQGETAEFTVTAGGTAPFTYQWSFGGSSIVGATTETLTLSNVQADQAGNYAVDVTNAAGTVSSRTALLEVVVPAMISAELTDQVVATGEQVIFSVNASGSEPLSYQWLLNGEPISGATSSSLVLEDPQGADSGSYQVVITNAGGQFVSGESILTVSDPVVVTSQPTVETVAEGGSVTLNTGATGSEPVSYQWFYNGSAIIGETGSTLNLSGLTADQSGQYSVEIANAVSRVQTEVAELTVAVAPVITQQETTANEVLEGGGIALTASVSGTPPLSYQWMRDGVEIEGATDQTLNLNNLTGADEGIYSVRIANAAGTVESEIASVSVIVPATVDSGQQGDSVVAVGDPFTLTVNATGTPPFTYQWYKDGAPIDGATQDAFSVDAAQAGDAGRYSVVVSNAVGSIAGPAFNVTVIDGVGIVSDPQNFDAKRGDEVVMTVRVEGTGPFKYQWEFNGSVFRESSKPELVLPGVHLSAAGNYRVRVSNGVSEAVSGEAALTVTGQAQLSGLPSLVQVEIGDDLVLKVSAAGAPPFTHQWQLNGVNIDGATTDTYRIPNVQPPDGGTYTVTVTDAGGATTSELSSVIVITPELGLSDDVGNASPTSALNGDGRGNNVGASSEAGEPSHAGGRPAKRSAWMAWDSPGIGIASFSTRGSGFDTILAVYKGSPESLEKVASDEDGGGFLTSATSFNTEAGVTYYVAVDGFEGAQGAIALRWDWVQTAEALPVIQTQPQSQTVLLGQPVEFSIAVESPSGSPLFYQWYVDGELIVGANGPAYNLSNAGALDVGEYTVEVSNAGGKMTSTGAVLQINLIATGAEGVGIDAVDKIGSSSQTGEQIVVGPASFGDGKSDSIVRRSVRPIRRRSLLQGTRGEKLFSSRRAVKDAGEPNHCRVLGGASTWFIYEPPQSGALRVSTEGSSYDTVLAAYLSPATEVDYTKLQEVKCDDNSGSDGQTSVMEFTVEGGTRYYLVIDGINGSKGLVHFTYELSQAPVLSQPTWFGVDAASGQVDESQDKPVVGAGSSVEFRVGIGGLPSTAAVSYQWRRNGIDVVGGTEARLLLNSLSQSDSGLYSVEVTTFAGTVESQQSRFTVAEPIQLLVSPDDQTVVAGRSAYFAVVPFGAGPFEYQWSLNGEPLIGLTTSALVLTDLQQGDAGVYEVSITDGVSQTSASATLTVQEALLILTHPSGGTVNAGENLLLTVSAQGVAPLSYQWQRNGVDILGATTATFAITGVQINQAGDYTVVVSNAFGNLSSEVAVMTVRVQLSIVQQPVSQAVVRGDRVEFSVVASGSGAVTYQWQLNGSDLPGAADSTLVLDSVQDSDLGTYRVIVSDSVGSVTSVEASLALQVLELLSFVRGADGAFTLEVVGGEGLEVEVQATLDFIQWSAVGVFRIKDGRVEFTDLSAGNNAFQLYRLLVAP